MAQEHDWQFDLEDYIRQKHIEGKIDIATAQNRIISYYEQRDATKKQLYK